MARPLLIEFPGAVYRVTSRGDQREAIHEDRASPCLADRDRAGNRALRCRHSRLLPDGQPLSFGHPCWSGYNTHTGNATSSVWLDTPAVHGYLLGRDAATEADWRRAGSRYAALMAAGRGFDLWDEARSQQIYLGDAEFIERMLALIRKDTGPAKDIPRTQRSAQAKPIDYYLKQNKERDGGIHDAVPDSHAAPNTALAAAFGATIYFISTFVKLSSEFLSIRLLYGSTPTNFGSASTTSEITCLPDFILRRSSSNTDSRV